MLKLLNENEPVRKGRMKEERERKEEHKKARMKAGREGQRNRRQVRSRRLSGETDLGN